MAKKSYSVDNIIFKIFIYCFIGYIIIFIYSLIVTGIDSFFGDDGSTSNLADGFTISAYNVVLNVKKNNKIDVTENITVNWYETNHHGIYKFTPLWLEYTGQDDKTIRRRSRNDKIYRI